MILYDIDAVNNSFLSVIQAYSSDQVPMDINNDEHSSSSSVSKKMRRSTFLSPPAGFDRTSLPPSLCCSGNNPSSKIIECGINYLHCFAVKSCPLSYVLHRAVGAGLGLECASIMEVQCMLDIHFIFSALLLYSSLCFTRLSWRTTSSFFIPSFSRHPLLLHSFLPYLTLATAFLKSVTLLCTSFVPFILFACTFLQVKHALKCGCQPHKVVFDRWHHFHYSCLFVKCFFSWFLTFSCDHIIPFKICN